MALSVCVQSWIRQREHKRKGVMIDVNKGESSEVVSLAVKLQCMSQSAFKGCVTLVCFVSQCWRRTGELHSNLHLQYPSFNSAKENINIDPSNKN